MLYFTLKLLSVRGNKPIPLQILMAMLKEQSGYRRGDHFEGETLFYHLDVHYSWLQYFEHIYRVFHFRVLKSIQVAFDVSVFFHGGKCH
jgi:hypothetical protein